MNLPGGDLQIRTDKKADRFLNFAEIDSRIFAWSLRSLVRDTNNRDMMNIPNAA